MAGELLNFHVSGDSAFAIAAVPIDSAASYATGRVTGPHLHFIARYGTITVDPAGLTRAR